MQFKKHDRRQVRIEKQLQESLAAFLLKNLNMNEDGLVSVTRVQIPRDLKNAEVYVHQYGKTEADHENLIEKLEKRVGLIQKHISHDLKLRFCPRLEFRYDEAFDKTLGVDKLIYDLTKSGAIKKNDESSD
jgi:ribosome-binding factor A